MGLWKRGNVYWAYFYVDGVRHQHTTGTENRRRAEAVLRKLQDEAHATRHEVAEADPNITFCAVASQFVASGIARPHHLYHLRILLPYFGDVRVRNLTKNLAAEFRKARISAKAIKDATVNRDLSVLRHILYWAMEEQLIPANPLARMRMARERKTRKPVLSVQDEAKILEAAPEHLRRIALAAVDTGMRRGEITNQRWEDVDFSRRLLYVTHSKTPEGEMREIPLTSRLFELLKQISKREGLIFTYNDAAVRIIKRSWHTALRRADVPYLRFHDLRHTFATRLMEAGVVQDVRMALMGHSSGQGIHSTYVHVELPAKREAIVKLEQWVKSQLESDKPKEA